MAKPLAERILTAPYQAMGIDLYQSSKNPMFRGGARVWGYLYDNAEYTNAVDNKNIKSDGMEYVYAILNRPSEQGAISAAAGMYGHYDDTSRAQVFMQDSDDNSYTKRATSNVMVICHVGPFEYAWFLVLNGDPINPLNPAQVNPAQGKK